MSSVSSENSETSSQTEDCPSLVEVSSDFLLDSDCESDEEEFTSNVRHAAESLRMLNSQAPNPSRVNASHSSIRASETVQLISPADLPPAYQFIAQHRGTEYLVEVPKSGVSKGEEFRAQIICEYTSPLFAARPDHSIPHGSWRDGLWNCFSLGVCHPVLCLAVWFPPLLLSQVMTRMGLGANGKDQNDNEDGDRWSVFRSLPTIFLLHFIFIETALSALVMAQIHARDAGYGPVPSWAYILLAIRAMCRIALVGYFCLLTYRTRTHIRERYSIPERDQSCYDDCLISVCCPSLSIAQMARHTADYATYNAMCCSPTGLSEYAPPV